MIPASKEALELFQDGSIALSHMESKGMRVDLSYLKQATIYTDKKIKGLELKLKSEKLYKTWSRIYGSKAKLSSPIQLADVLFNRLKHPCLVFTEKGKPSTSEEALEVIDDPFVKEYVHWKQLQKAKGTYLEGIKRELVGDRVHASFNLNLVRTYRGSCNSPNLTNIPVRNPEIGALVRKCFIPSKGCDLLEVDFARSEVHVSVWYHKDPTMLKYLMDPTTDMHRDMGSEICLLKEEEVAHAVRHTAKNCFVFPQFYGSVWFQCAPHIWSALQRDPQGMRVKLPGDDKKKPSGIPILEHLKSKGIKKLGSCNPQEPPDKGTFAHHLKEVEKRFWQERFKVYTQWKEEWWQQYLRTGGFRMLTGFTVNNLHKKNDVLNYPIQGVSFHTLLWSIIRQDRFFHKKKFKSRNVCQIHDCTLIDCHKSETQDVLNKVHRVMTEEIVRHWPWIISPLEVEVDCSVEGTSWHDKKSWGRKGGIWCPN